jgi:hypothetical protein
MALGVIDKRQWWFSRCVEWYDTWALKILTPSICTVGIWKSILCIIIFRWTNITEFGPILIYFVPWRHTFVWTLSCIIQVHPILITVLKINLFLNIRRNFVTKLILITLMITVSHAISPLFSNLHHRFIHHCLLAFELLYLIVVVTMDPLNKWLILVTWQLLCHPMSPVVKILIFVF